MVDFRVPSWIFPKLAAPRHHFINKLLPRRLVLWECAQQAQQFPLAPTIWSHFTFSEYIQQEDAQVAARSTLSGL